MRIDETNYDVFYKLIQKGFDIDIFWKDAENIDGYIEIEKLYELIQDLSVEIGNLEEEIEDTKKHYEEEISDMKEDIRDNYRPIPRSEQECWEPRG